MPGAPGQPSAGAPAPDPRPVGVLRATIHLTRGDLVLGALLVMVHQAAEVCVPVMIGVVVDRGVATGDGGAMLRWLSVLAGLFVVLSAAGCCGVYVYERLVMRAEHEVRMLVARRALHPGGGAEAEGRPGELVSLASVDSARIGESMGAIVMAAGALAGTLVAAGVLLATSVRLGLVVLLGVPLVLILIRVLAAPLERRSEQQYAAVAGAAGVAADLLDGLRVLKGLGAERAGADRYRSASRRALAGALRSAQVRGGYEGATLALSGVMLVVVAWLGGRLAVEGTISIGELIAAVGLTQFLVGPLGNAAYAGAAIARGRGSARRVTAVLDAPAAVTGGALGAPAVPRGALRLRGVTAGPLAGLDLDVAAGEHLGVVAADPADAAALLAVLGREVAPDDGIVEVDGRALADLDLESARALVLAAPHDAVLFEGTLAENVGAGVPGAALTAAAADEIADGLPDGLDTPIGADGRSLSGGQRQRVALARALAAQAPVLVLHEPTTAVDAATEDRIARGVARLRAGRTTVLVTTSPALLATTDRVVVLSAGRIAISADHAALAAADADYRALVLA